MGLCIQVSEADAGSEELAGLRQGLELVVGRHHGLVAVTFAQAALGVEVFLREEAGPVEVQVGREDGEGEGLDEVLQDGEEEAHR